MSVLDEIWVTAAGGLLVGPQSWRYFTMCTRGGCTRAKDTRMCVISSVIVKIAMAISITAKATKREHVTKAVEIASLPSPRRLGLCGLWSLRGDGK